MRCACGTRLSGSTNASIDACCSCRPRTTAPPTELRPAYRPACSMSMADQAFFSTLLDIPIEILVAYARDYAPGQRTVAFCLDTSGNYSYPKKALDGFTQLVADTARPGDVFYFIAAGDNPLAPEAIFHTVRMPVPILPAPTTVSASPTPPGPSPTPCNFFDAPCRNRAAAEQQQAQATATAVQQAAAEATAAPTRTASALIEQSQRYLSSSVTDLRGLSIPPAASSNGP